VNFDAVRFHYPTRPDHQALDGFTLQVSPGEAVALVGPSGAGKSTAFQLLLRFFDPSSGVVRFDGVDIATLDPLELRSQIAVVSQDPTIFAGSVGDNIRYGRPAATDAEVHAAAIAAAADEFIIDARNTPRRQANGASPVGRPAAAGCIARAIPRHAPLLADEATSAPDAENERLQSAADQSDGRRGRGRTTLVIAHRL
jgi:ATP-binding cassette subfamily B protein